MMIDPTTVQGALDHLVAVQATLRHFQGIEFTKLVQDMEQPLATLRLALCPEEGR